MSNLLTAKINSLFNEERGLHLLLCVGNSLRSDDGLGPMGVFRVYQGQYREKARIAPDRIG